MGPFTFDPFAGRSTYASFPSGHSTTAFCMAVALSFFLPRWRAPLFLLAGLIAFSRVAVGAHYPSDTIAGAYLGAVSAFLVAWAFARRDIAFTFRGGRLAARAMGAIMPALRRIFAGSR
jgi:undecaprenyl-diphosphatase